MVRITKILFILMFFLLIIFTTNLASAGNRQIYARDRDSNLLKTQRAFNETIETQSKLLKRNKRYYLLWSGISKVNTGLPCGCALELIAIFPFVVCFRNFNARRNTRQCQLAYIKYGA